MNTLKEQVPTVSGLAIRAKSSLLTVHTHLTRESISFRLTWHVASYLIEIAFVVDATGSMSDEIQYLQAELADVVDRVG